MHLGLWWGRIRVGREVERLGENLLLPDQNLRGHTTKWWPTGVLSTLLTPQRRKFWTDIHPGAYRVAGNIDETDPLVVDELHAVPDQERYVAPIVTTVNVRKPDLSSEFTRIDLRCPENVRLISVCGGDPGSSGEPLGAQGRPRKRLHYNTSQFLTNTLQYIAV